MESRGGFGRRGGLRPPKGRISNSPELFAGIKRNFQVFQPLDLLEHLNHEACEKPLLLWDD